MINKLICILTLGLFLASCGERPMFSDAHSFDNKTWTQEDVARFEVNVDDTLQPYDLGLTVRNTTSYAYSNLWMYISITAPDNTTSKVAYKMNIAHPDGSWIGNKSGTVVESKLLFGSTTFPLKGTYVYEITQAVNQQEIDELLDITLEIKEKRSS